VETIDESDIVDTADVGMRDLPRDPDLVAKAGQRGFSELRRGQKF
jgi:hypothetical protein